MDNQHRLIEGYRELSADEIELINEIKKDAAILGVLLDCLEQSGSVDKRWLNIARTDLQKGFMSLTRSIEKPGGF